jgi:hypothetical protein
MRRPYPLVASLLLWASVSAAGPLPLHMTEISVSSSHLRVGDILADLDAEAAAFDLGPAPAASGSRVVDRDEIVRAFQEHGVEPPRFVPAAVRIVRRMRRMEAREISDLVRNGLSEGLPRGATITEIRGSRASIPDGWTRTVCELPRPPHRTGAVTSSASLTFYENEQALWRISVPVELALSQEAKLYDVERGSHVTLVIRRGLVEVGASGTTAADADIGDLVPVVLLPSGRTLSARLEDREHAVAVGAP